MLIRKLVISFVLFPGLCINALGILTLGALSIAQWKLYMYDSITTLLFLLLYTILATIGVKKLCFLFFDDESSPLKLTLSLLGLVLINYGPVALIFLMIN